MSALVCISQEAGVGSWGAFHCQTGCPHLNIIVAVVSIINIIVVGSRLCKP